MSVFIVKEQTINEIVTYMCNHKFVDSNTVILNKLSNDILNMNKKAFEFKYNEKTQIDKMTFKYSIANPIQIFKNINCLLYQCSEGNLSNTKLFKKLLNMANFIAKQIVISTPAYMDAEWR